MNDGTLLTPEQAWNAVAIGEAKRRLQAYDRVQSRPGRQLVNAKPCPGRNEPCPCGSGKKSKRCCFQGH